MKLNGHKVIFVAACIIGILLFAYPSINAIGVPKAEKFSELWILGPGHMAENYPFNVKGNETYTVYVGVGNNMGSSAYYSFHVKFRNQTEPSPNSTARTPSTLPTLHTYSALVEAGQTWEAPLTFSVSNVSRINDKILVEDLTINNKTYSVDKQVVWDADGRGYYCQLFVELWIYNAYSDTFEYHNRFVGIWLNMTSYI